LDNREIKVRATMVLDRAAALYRRKVGKQFAAAAAVYAAWALLLFLLWQGFSAVLPVLRAQSDNAIVAGIYAVGILVAAVFVLWSLRRIALTVAAEAIANGSRIRNAVTAGLAELLCDCLLLGLMGAGIYFFVGLNGLARVVLQPSPMILTWALPCVLIVCFWLTVKTLVIPLAMREERHFMPAVFAAVREVFAGRAFGMLLRVKAAETVLGALALGAIGFLASRLFAAPAWLGGLSLYVAPLWFLIVADMAAVVFAPFHSLLPSVCADAQTGMKAKAEGSAGLASRALAFLLDVVLVAAGLIGLAAMVLLPMAGADVVFESLARVNTAVLVVCGIALMACVCVLCALFEAICNGQTVGKRILRIRVVTADGGAVSFGQAFLRGLVRVLDLCLVGGLCIFFTANKTRLGDVAAETRVVYE